MVKHSRGYRTRTRALLRKRPRERGLQGLSRLLINYEVGEKVVIDINPSVVKGQPHKRFHGKVGTIVGKRGRAYVIKIVVGSKEKTIISRPEHIKPFLG